MTKLIGLLTRDAGRGATESAKLAEPRDEDISAGACEGVELVVDRGEGLAHRQREEGLEHNEGTGMSPKAPGLRSNGRAEGRTGKLGGRR